MSKIKKNGVKDWQRSGNVEHTRHKEEGNESARRSKEKVLITNSPSEEEISTEPKKIDRNSLHAYKHMISQNYDRRIGTTETHYRNRKYQVTQLFQPEVSTDNIQGLHNTEPWSH